MITQTELQKFLSYDPDTGVFLWKIPTSRRVHPGDKAGWIGVTGHRHISVCGTSTTASRLAWLYVHGELPNSDIEHINEDCLDCRISNLRIRPSSSKNLPPLTAEHLREILHYNPQNGIFTWIARASHRISIGKAAGKIRPNGYSFILIDGTFHRAHRLAWMYIHGEWPTKHIDHINGVGSDNRISNLREAEVFQNMANSKKPTTNKSGYKGVSWSKAAKKWQSHIKHEGRNLYLGIFEDAKDAHKAYCNAAHRLKGAFARTS